MKLNVAALTVSTLALTCLAGSLSSCVMRQTAGTRASGQSKLMDDTFAAQNACNPEDHTRPFIIEWDATDMSSFESLAHDDIVMVKYEGCKLRVLDECRNDNIRGSQGAYKPPEWTSGGLETIDIHNEGELYAKLPLGKATLGGRVQGGERFHMEYFVAGTVYATRDAVYRDDIAENPGCDSATHFVYGYNLGAFALGSTNNLDAEAGASMFGYGAGGSRSSGHSAEKKGGDLGACQSDAAREIDGCKAPIRLNLRKIRDGASPETEAMAAPDTAESVSAAAMVNAKVEMSEEAQAHFDAARAKLSSGDGPGCIAEFDAHDKADPNHKSTDPKTQFALMRAQCLMMAGKCDAGKALMRRNGEANQTAAMTPEALDRWVEAMVAMHCQGKMSKRDQMIQALYRLQQGSMTAKTPDYCREQIAKIEKLRDKVKSKGPDDTWLNGLEAGLFSNGPSCYARAGDCEAALRTYEANLYPATKEAYAKMDADKRAAAVHRGFESSVKRCEGKIPAP